MDSENIDQIVYAAKQLRKKKCKENTMPIKGSFDKLSFFFSVIDEYDAAQNWLKNKYTKKQGFSLEHFVVPDNRGGKVTWKDNDNECKIYIKLPSIYEFKKRTINYIIIHHNLNESMEDYDIIEKIKRIRDWYCADGRNMPKHVKQYIECIEKMGEYKELLKEKDLEYNEEMVRQKYEKFIEAYFSDKNEQNLLEELNSLFMKAFVQA